MIDFFNQKDFSTEMDSSAKQVNLECKLKEIHAYFFL